MNYNLCIDLGNTKGKAAIFNNQELVNSYQFSYDEIEQALSDIIAEYNPEKAILSSVINYENELITFLNEKIKKIIIFNNETRLPIVNAYSSPESLGSDRLALVVAANHQHPENDNLVISLGSAITYNYIAKNKFFRGGAISPGFMMRIKSLNDYTDKLPLINPQGEVLNLGYDTDTSIRSGVINGITSEIDGFIDQYKKEYPGIKIFITGGDYPFFEFRLKNQIFADSQLLLKGLNTILTNNVI